MAEQGQSPLVYGRFTQGLQGAARSENIERSRPWTDDEIHAYLLKHKMVTSMTRVLLSDYEELLKVFSGEPIAVDNPVEER